MRILLVEDDTAITIGLQYSLEREGYDVLIAKNVNEALQLLQSHPFHFVIIDIGLPDGNGFQVCLEAKKRHLPVLFLSAQDEEATIVKGLDLGGDDYVTKPFRLQELLSRIRSILRRYQTSRQEDILVGDLIINQKQGKVFRGQQEIYLSALEYQLLLIFIHHPNQIMTRMQLLDALWDQKGQYVEDNTLSVTIRRLREKIEKDDKEPQLLKTIRGLGYRMEGFHES